MRKLINGIECFFESIAKVFKWLPIIWKDRDWDQSYFWRIVEMKLSTMEDLFENYGSGANSKNDAKKIRIMKNLAKRMYDEDYLSNALTQVESQFGQLKVRFVPVKNSNHKEMIIETSGKQEDDARKRAHRKSDAMEQQDLDMFCKMLNKNIRSFWD